jgi:peptide/nickel transport system permease protein
MVSQVVTGPMSEPKERPMLVSLFIRLVKEKPLGTFGLVIILVLLICGIFADLSWGSSTWRRGIAPYPMGQIELKNMLAPPSWQHPLGTDNLGRDELSNIIYGARVSVIIGLGATSLMTIISILIGALSGLIGGKFDLIVQRFVDAWQSIPGMLILLIVMSILGMGLWQLIVCIGVPMGIGYSRMIRSAVISIKENVFVDAARSIGCSTGKLLMKHIMPNIMPVVIIGFSMFIGGVILMEAGLSFLGYGVPPGVPSWGSMLSREGRKFMEIAPMLAIWPGLALSLIVYGANMFGDAARDLLDPKLRGGLGSYRGISEKKRAELLKRAEKLN